MSKNKKGLHVRRSTIFSLKIGEERKKKIYMQPAVCAALALGNFFLIFIKFCYLQHICKSFRKIIKYVVNNTESIFLKIHHSLETSI